MFQIHHLNWLPLIPVKWCLPGLTESSKKAGRILLPRRICMILVLNIHVIVSWKFGTSTGKVKLMIKSLKEKVFQFSPLWYWLLQLLFLKLVSIEFSAFYANKYKLLHSCAYSNSYVFSVCEVYHLIDNSCRLFLLFWECWSVLCHPTKRCGKDTFM